MSRWFRDRFRRFLRGALSILPVASMLLAMVAPPLMRELDVWTRWGLLGYGLEGARGIAGASAASVFSLTVLIFSITRWPAS